MQKNYDQVQRSERRFAAPVQFFQNFLDNVWTGWFQDLSVILQLSDDSKKALWEILESPKPELNVYGILSEAEGGMMIRSMDEIVRLRAKIHLKNDPDLNKVSIYLSLFYGSIFIQELNMLRNGTRTALIVPRGELLGYVNSKDEQVSYRVAIELFNRDLPYIYTE